MMNTLTSLYRFEQKADGSLFWGYGTLAWGETVTIRIEGGRATIHHHEWFWDGGDVEWERSTTTTCYLSQVWGLLPEKVYRYAR